MSLLSLLLLLGLAPPQQYQIQPLTPDELTNGFMAYQAQQVQRLDRNQLHQIESTDATCFAIRSYIFRREDGHVPELVGTTTCTPGNVFRQRRVGSHEVRLVPAN